MEELNEIRQDLVFAIDNNDKILLGFAINKLDTFLYKKNIAKVKEVKHSDHNRLGNPNGCDCVHCTNYDMFKWATIMECKCACHDSSNPSGHDELCCPFPNGQRKNNPYDKLKPAIEYRKILDEWESDNQM